MFRSSSFHTIDAKGRIIIPTRFRDVIKAGGGNGVVVSTKDKCLYAFTFDGWRVIEEKILALNSGHSGELRRFLLGNAHDCLCDKQERVLIPPNLREYAGLEKEIVLVGLLDRFEIWSRNRWDKVQLKIEQEMEKEEVKQEIASLGL